MTRFIHDKFAKDYLEELLKDYGEVKPSEKVSGEIKEIDVVFTPFQQQTLNLQVLGLLGRFAEYPALMEPFRNAASSDEICDCLIKLLEVRAQLRREAKANNTKLEEWKIPKLWVLTPTASVARLSAFNVKQEQGWLSGVYFLGDALRTAIVVIHQLPKTPETLWLRVLGRGSVQSQAIAELSELQLNHPYRQAALELVYNLRENLRINQHLTKDDQELVMRLEPLYQKDREQAKFEGLEQGREEGRQQGREEGRQQGREEGRQQGREEGRQQGREEGRQREQSLVLRLLNRRIGEINSSLVERVGGLSIEQLEELGEALLDFSAVADLEAWLHQQSR
ncbi:DUF4351 domain-containing protein [Aetokthonos hydrillicola Thurmond2011]|jgi:hypothetical protein|uniref:DUF4351 domain-containing protein n=1 Tax=Aetokthonos hydrillicola Thurmond2011 TaxID=2712845 RepID=A0AAP5MB30_9CYAN|nr:DUF4351 domain-containing protein [Aetokthonos hydrillicola]MBO3462988.1 DUF4351 domain-containing protein [Aetokthonos hydrillicola CCALA 1050]MBW4586353.1 DUF4351 domain-containing protein [Aetokthonos hydrillicola CCALA 1050]MDR9897482.1 DUF4351 domain-containing protein [Aetokthonos hydrillicola Thurmond2011]